MKTNTKALTVPALYRMCYAASILSCVLLSACRQEQIDAFNMATEILVAVVEDSCEYAFDGACDEPTYCDYGTDTTDCSGSSSSDYGSGNNTDYGSGTDQASGTPDQLYVSPAESCVNIEWDDADCYEGTGNCIHTFGTYNSCSEPVTVRFGSNDWGHDPNDMHRALTIYPGDYENSGSITVPWGTDAQVIYCVQYNDHDLRETDGSCY